MAAKSICGEVSTCTWGITKSKQRTVLVYCWPTVYDVGSTINQHDGQVNALLLVQLVAYQHDSSNVKLRCT